MNKLINFGIKIIVFVFIFLISFIGNVYFHEGGHYLAAEMFGLRPSLEVASIDNSLNYILESKPITSVSFDEAGKIETFIIGLLGPLINLLISIIFLIIYLANRNDYVKMVSLTGFIPSIMSFVVNILPFNGTDGSVLLSLLN